MGCIYTETRIFAFFPRDRFLGAKLLGRGTYMCNTVILVATSLWPGSAGSYSLQRVGKSPSPVPPRFLTLLGSSPQPTADPTPGGGGRQLSKTAVPEAVTRVEEAHSAWSLGWFPVSSATPCPSSLLERSMREPGLLGKNKKLVTGNGPRMP